MNGSAVSRGNRFYLNDLYGINVECCSNKVCETRYMEGVCQTGVIHSHYLILIF